MKKTPKDFQTVDGVVVATWKEDGCWYASFTARMPGRSDVVRYKTKEDPDTTKEKLLAQASVIIRRDALYRV